MSLDKSNSLVDIQNSARSVDLENWLQEHEVHTEDLNRSLSARQINMIAIAVS